GEAPCSRRCAALAHNHWPTTNRQTANGNSRNLHYNTRRGTEAPSPANRLAPAGVAPGAPARQTRESAWFTKNPGTKRWRKDGRLLTCFCHRLDGSERPASGCSRRRTGGEEIG